VNKYLVFGLLIGAALVGNYYKLSFFSSDVHVSILDISVLILTLASKKIVIPKPLLLFLVIGVISLIPAIFYFGPLASLVGLMYLIRFGLYSLFFMVISKLLSAKDLSRLTMILGITFVITAWAQYLFFPDIRTLQIANWDAHYYRVVGTLFDPGFLGIILLFFLIFLLNFKELKYKILWGITYLAFVLTYSRSSFLAFFVATGFIAWRQKSGKFLLGMWLLMAVTLPLLPRASDGEGVKLERTNSIQARIDNWRNSLIIFRDHPIIGVGFNTYRYAQKQYGFLTENKWLSSHAGAGADSSILFVLATTGLVGLFSYLYYLKSLWGYSHLQIYLVPLLVHSLFLNSLFYPFVLVWIGLIIAGKSQLALSESDSRRSHKQ